MPKPALKTKTKRTAAKPPFETSTTAHHHADEDTSMGEETSEDEKDIPEKDDDEKKLERMLFGDDEGFIGALKSQQERADAMALTVHSDEENGGADEDVEENEEGVMDNMADADVRIPHPVLCGKRMYC